MEHYKPNQKNSSTNSVINEKTKIRDFFGIRVLNMKVSHQSVKKRTVFLASKINLALHIGDKQTGKNG